MDEPKASFGGDVFTAQRKYWDAWMDLTRTTLGKSTDSASASDSWSDGLAKWWELVSTGAPPSTKDFYERLLAVGQTYFGMAEQIAQRGGQDTGAALDRWLSDLSSGFSTMAEGVRVQANRGARDAFAFWDMPLDTWQRTMSSMMPFPGDYLHALRGHDVKRVADSIKDRFERFLTMPAVGYSREAQDQYQKLARLLLEYAEAFQQYNVGLARVGMRSIEGFRKKVNDAGKDGPVDSLRKLYDLWIDASEEVYGEYATSEEYTRLYGRMVNAMMAAKQQSALLVDEVLEAMNIPTRNELNTVHRRVHDLRRENHALRAELAQIRELLESKGSKAAPAAAPKPTPKPAPRTRKR